MSVAIKEMQAEGLAAVEAIIKRDDEAAKAEALAHFREQALIVENWRQTLAQKVLPAVLAEQIDLDAIACEAHPDELQFKVWQHILVHFDYQTPIKIVIQPAKQDEDVPMLDSYWVGHWTMRRPNYDDDPAYLELAYQKEFDGDKIEDLSLALGLAHYHHNNKANIIAKVAQENQRRDLKSLEWRHKDRLDRITTEIEDKQAEIEDAEKRVQTFKGDLLGLVTEQAEQAANLYNVRALIATIEIAHESGQIADLAELDQTKSDLAPLQAAAAKVSHDALQAALSESQ